MRKLFFIVIIIFILLSLTTCKTLMSSFKEPEVSLHSAELMNISLNGAQVLCKIAVLNPNSLEIPFPETAWELFINTNSFLSGTIRNENRIGKRTTTIVEVPVSFEYQGIINSIASVIGTTQADYKAALALKFYLPVFGEKIWNFSHEGKLPIPQAPKLGAATVNIDSIDLTKAELLVTVNVENPNVFEIPAPVITYNYQLNRNSFIRGRIENDKPLAPSSVTPLNFRLIVTYSDLFRSFASLMRESQVNSLLVLDLNFGIPLFDGPVYNLQIPGTLPIRR